MNIVTICLCLVLGFSSCQASTKKEQEIEIVDQQGLVKSVESKNIKSVESALKAGQNVNSVDANKRNLLLIATINQDLPMVKLLVSYKADVNQQADNFDSPFLYAGATGQTEMLKLFLENGARFDVFNRYHGSALIPACERGHVETVRLLANTKGYPIDHVNRLGWTALMEAIVLGDGSKKYQEIVQILKDAGSKMDIPDKDGISPLQHAKNRGFTEIQKIIEG